ncbi:MAG TPA: hypothetical protein VMT76_08650 [Puia sp.]|nr:hypothetical protein [Puia sp.]
MNLRTDCALNFRVLPIFLYCFSFLDMTGMLKTGHSKTKEWNSPFSPHGSTWAGKSFRIDSSMILPQKLFSR